jgi:hypothetical protein
MSNDVSRRALASEYMYGRDNSDPNSGWTDDGSDPFADLDDYIACLRSVARSAKTYIKPSNREFSDEEVVLLLTPLEHESLDMDF